MVIVGWGGSELARLGALKLERPRAGVHQLDTPLNVTMSGALARERLTAMARSRLSAQLVHGAPGRI